MTTETKVGEARPIEELLARYPKERTYILDMLKDVQDAYGYITLESATAVGDHLGVSAAYVYGVLSFYDDFRVGPPGKHVITLCRGPACFLRNGECIKETFEALLGIQVGQTTLDGQFTLWTRACDGSCDHAALFWIDGIPHTRAKVSDLKALLSQWRDGPQG